MNKLAKTILAFLAIVLLFSTCKKEEEKGAIRGTATSSASNEPLEGVNITLSPNNASSVTTGTDGKYAFSDLKPGEYLIQLKKDNFETTTKNVTVTAGTTVSADVTLAAIVPVLSVSADLLDFEETLTTLPIDIINIGGGQLNWAITENVPWISVVPTSGMLTTESQSINVIVDRASLTAGPHAQSITITSNGGSKTIMINAIAIVPVLSVSPETLDFSSTVNSKTITLSNIGNGTLTFNAVTNPNHSWLSVSPLTGSVSDQQIQMTVVVDRTDLAPSTYNGTIVMSTNANVVSIPVSMIVPEPTPPTIVTDSVYFITMTSAKSSVNITNSGGASVIARGVCWSTAPNPSTESSHTSDGSGTGHFVSSITGLMANTNYFLRAYATNSFGTSYGEEFSFTTLENPVLPTVVTANATAITQNTATSGGNVTSNGGATITAYGVCWSTATNPTIANSHTTDGSGTGIYTSYLTGLMTNTLYYVRAYATNNIGTAYGEEYSFTTLENPIAPTVTTTDATAITPNTATSGGNVLSDGGAIVIARGVCWSTSSNPTIANSHTTDDGGTGTYASQLTGLAANTLYYVRAYATNSVGTSYGSNVSFTTLSSSSAPTVTTLNATAITQNTASSGGNVTSDGGANVTARGVCWSTSSNPTIANSHTTDGSGTGSFTSQLTGLNANTMYYVRAYATNSAGTSYGSNVSFTTLSSSTAPTVTTTSATAITQNTATSGGNVTSDGGATVTARGVCWSTSSNPTIANSHTTDGSGTGSYTSQLTGLNANTMYYVRAYATNSAGTSYGSNVSFTTLSSSTAPTVTTTSATAITQNTATSGGNVTSDGGATVTAKGVCWSTSSNPTIANSHTTDGSGTGSYTSQLTGLAANTMYYVRAYATNSVGTSYGNQISFTTLQVAGNTETEPNDAYYQANPLTLGQIMNADIGYSDEFDWYTFVPETTSSLIVKITNLNPAGTSNGYLGNWYVYHSGNLNSAIANSSYTTPNNFHEVTLTVQAGETFYIKVMRFSDTHFAPYKIETTLLTSTYNDIGEPNDGYSQAYSIDLNNTYFAFVGYSDEFDWYTFVPETTSSLIVKITNLNPTGTSNGYLGNWYVYHSGNLNSAIANSSYTTPTNFHEVTLTVQAGQVYYLKATRFSETHFAPYNLLTTLLP